MTIAVRKLYEFKWIYRNCNLFAMSQNLNKNYYFCFVKQMTK